MKDRQFRTYVHLNLIDDSCIGGPTTEQLVAPEISALLADSLDDILQPPFEKACTLVRFAVDYVFELGLLELLHQKVMKNALDKNMANNFDTSVAADKISEYYCPKKPSWHQSSRSYDVEPANLSPPIALPRRWENS